MTIPLMMRGTPIMILIVIIVLTIMNNNQEMDCFCRRNCCWSEARLAFSQVYRSNDVQKIQSVSEGLDACIKAIERGA